MNKSQLQGAEKYLLAISLLPTAFLTSGRKIPPKPLNSCWTNTDPEGWVLPMLQILSSLAKLSSPSFASKSHILSQDN